MQGSGLPGTDQQSDDRAGMGHHKARLRAEGQFMILPETRQRDNSLVVYSAAGDTVEYSGVIFFRCLMQEPAQQFVKESAAD